MENVTQSTSGECLVGASHRTTQRVIEAVTESEG